MKLLFFSEPLLTHTRLPSPQTTSSESTNASNSPRSRPGNSLRNWTSSRSPPLRLRWPTRGTTRLPSPLLLRQAPLTTVRPPPLWSHKPCNRVSSRPRQPPCDLAMETGKLMAGGAYLGARTGTGVRLSLPGVGQMASLKCVFQCTPPVLSQNAHDWTRSFNSLLPAAPPQSSHSTRRPHHKPVPQKARRRQPPLRAMLRNCRHRMLLRPSRGLPPVDGHTISLQRAVGMGGCGYGESRQRRSQSTTTKRKESGLQSLLEILMNTSTFLIFSGRTASLIARFFPT